MASQDRRRSLEKQPSEVLTYGVDFANDLGVGETISSADVSAIDLSDDSDAGSIILDGTENISGTVISQTLKGGVDESRYKITFKATTTVPHVFEADIIMTVQEL